jgi:hypothetical protein
MTLERAALLSLAASLALLLATPAVAEEWKYDLELYLLAAGIEGTAGAGPQEAEINLSFSEIFEDLELGGMGLFRARKGRWGMLGDVIFVSLESTEEVAVVEEDQLILEGLGIYMVTDRIPGSSFAAPWGCALAPETAGSTRWSASGSRRP